MAELKETRASILDTAKKCVCGDREQDYGTPESNFSTIAQLWTAFKGLPFTAVDVAIFLSLVKIGRIASGHGKADNWIDLAGYAACGGEIESAIIAELKRLEIPEMGKEDVSEPEYLSSGANLGKLAQGMSAEAERLRESEPVKGKYEGLSNDELFTKVCASVKGRCSICPISSISLDIPIGKGCEQFIKENPSKFRKIAIDWLNKQDGLEGKV